MGDDLDRHLACRQLALKQIGDCTLDGAAEDLERVAFDAQTFDIRRLDVPNARFVIVGGFDDCNADGLAPVLDPPTLPRRSAPQKQAMNSLNTQPNG